MAKTDLDTRCNADRREFMSLAARFGVAAATFVLYGQPQGGYAAESAEEDVYRKANARFLMKVGIAYPLEYSRYYPFIPFTVKKHIENLTQGEVYVELRANAQEGIGAELAAKVRQGKLQAAQHSVSNLAPFAPPVDLLNIPYWANTNQRFLNLIQSDIWQHEVGGRIRDHGVDILHYELVGPRTAATRKGFGKIIKTPDDIKGIKFRVPASRILRRFYRMSGAIPTPVPWGKTGQAMAEARADALDPSEQGLYIGPGGLRHQVESISFIQSVQNASVYSINLAWFDSLPSTVQGQIREAAELIFEDQLKAALDTARLTRRLFKQDGVTLYWPTENELSQWREVGGAQRKEWDDLKLELAGGEIEFQRFVKATQEAGKISIGDS